jgi:hypothetical protein
MAYLTLVVIAHIHQDRVRICNEFVESCGVHVYTFISHIKGFIFQPSSATIFVRTLIFSFKKLSLSCRERFNRTFSRKVYTSRNFLNSSNRVCRNGKLSIDTLMVHKCALKPPAHQMQQTGNF